MGVPYLNSSSTTRTLVRNFSFLLAAVKHNDTGRMLPSSTTKRQYNTIGDIQHPLRILFLGSDEFSIKSYEAVTTVFQSPSLYVVVSNRNNLLAKHVKAQGATDAAFHTSNNVTLGLWDHFRKEVSNTSPNVLPKFDLGVVSSFGHLVPSKVISQCQMGILNVHGSLLPRWRGAAPTAAAIINGDNVTGVSIMKIAPHRFDIGPVLHQVQVPLDRHIRTHELTSLLASVGADALKNVLQNLNHYLKIAIPQDESQATKAPKLSPEMSHIQWNLMDAVQVYNLFRGVSQRYKLKTQFQGRTVDLDDLGILQTPDDPGTLYSKFYKYSTTKSISDDNLVNVTADANPGDIHFLNKVLCVKCQCTSNELKRHWIFIHRIKINQKWMSPLDFGNGWLSKVDPVKRHFDSLSVDLGSAFTSVSLC